MNDKKGFLGGAALVVSAAVVFGLGKFAVGSFLGGSSEASIQAALLDSADQLNATLPMMVDEETRLDSASGSDRTFRYNYTMVNYASEDIDPEVFVSHMRPQLTAGVCTNKEMAVFVKHRIPVVYAYYGNQGKEIATLAVQSTDCD
ncbi:hypothetical protein [Marinimicrobium alkaliphilum]|uniref:hypothetical protein n=1 Tax=Marinimicrobium alkaliphilum TaxID=2202654 RepID=UPI000DB91A22|nr:hypothetical protein [Marinimicrobium alkaliphilum]